MGNYSELCVSDSELLGTGIGTCAKTLGPDVRFFLAEPTFTGTNAQLKTKAYWETAIKAKTVIPFPLVQEVEPQNVEATYFETASGSTFKTKAEKRKTMYQFIENIVVHSGMKSHSDRGWNVWFYTELGYLRCHTKGVDSYEGIKISQFFVNAQTTQNFTDPAHTPVIMEHNDVNDWDMEFGVLQPDFDMKDLEGVFQVDLQVLSATQLTGTLTVNIKLSVRGTNAPLIGVPLADLLLKDADGLEVVINSAVESPSGTYTVVATDAAITGTISTDGVITVGTDNYQSDTETYVTA